MAKNAIHESLQEPSFIELKLMNWLNFQKKITIVLKESLIS